MRVLASALRRHVGGGAFNNFQQGLLYALARYVARNGRAVALAGRLVNFIYIDNAGFRAGAVKIGVLQQLQDDVFNIVAHIPRLSQRGRVHNCEGHIQHTGQTLGKQGLTAAGRTNKQHIGLLQFDPVHFGAGGKAFVMIMHRHRNNAFRSFLAHHILVQEVLDLLGRRHVYRATALFTRAVFSNDFIAKFDALIADVHIGSCDKLAYFIVPLAAERARGRIHSRTLWRRHRVLSPIVAIFCRPALIC